MTALEPRLRGTLLLTLIAATLLRFWALPKGIPFALGVDEPEVIDRAVRMMKTADFNPHFFDYPAFYMYLQTIVAVLRFVWGAMHSQWASLEQAPTAAFYLWGRALTAAMGTASVWMLYEGARRWGNRTATLAAALFAVMPLHVRESHFVLTDVPTTFFVVHTFVLSLRAHERRTWGSFVMAGIMAGLAGATKYNGIVALVMPIGAALGSRDERPPRIGAALVVVASCVAAFLLAAPYTLLDLPNFLNQFARLASEYKLQNPELGPTWIIYLKHLRIALDWPGSVLVAAGMAAGLWQIIKGPHRAAMAIPLGFVLVYFRFISNQHIVYARYLLPVAPFLCLFAAQAVVVVVTWLARQRIGSGIQQALAIALVLIAIVPPARTSFGYNVDASRVWTTEQAYEWIERNVPRGSMVTIESRALLLPAHYRVENVKQLRQYSLEDYVHQGVQYLVASSQCYGEYVSNPQAFPAEYGDYMRLFRQTQELTRFIPSNEHPGPELRVLKVVTP